jgi:hypothetical protein
VQIQCQGEQLHVEGTFSACHFMQLHIDKYKLKITQQLKWNQKSHKKEANAYPGEKKAFSLR